MEQPHLANMPVLQGVIFRYVNEATDVPAFVALIEASQEIDKIDSHSSLESIPTIEEATHTFTSISPDTMLVAMYGEAMIAYVRITWWTEEDGTWLYLHQGRVHPDWRGKGLGTAFLQWAEERIRALAATHPTNGKGMFGANASSTEITATELLQSHGYKPHWIGAEMDLTTFGHLPEAHMPPGFQLRPFTSEQYRLIWEASNRFWTSVSTASAVPNEAEYQEIFSAPNFDPTLWQVAWHDDQPAGMIRNTIIRNIGYIDDVVVAPEHRRLGLATALMIHSIDALRARSVYKVRLHTDAENKRGAKTLYEKLGFRTVKLFPRYRKPSGT